MAKKKKKKGSQGPKEIAGIKLPKPLREPAGKLLKAVQSPVFVDVAAAALLSAAAALQQGRKAPAARPAAAGRSKRAAAAEAIGAVVTAKAIEGIGKLAESRRSGSGAAPAVGGKAKKG